MSITELFWGIGPVADKALRDEDVRQLSEALGTLVVAGVVQRAVALDELTQSVAARYKATDARAVAELALRRGLTRARAQELVATTRT